MREDSFIRVLELIIDESRARLQKIAESSDGCPVVGAIKKTMLGYQAMPSKKTLYATLGLALLVVSCSAIFIKAASEASALVIASYRLTIAVLLLAPLALSLKQETLRALTLKEWGLAFGSGLFLGLHFIIWISSLKYTSVASSVMLVTMNPVFVALGAWLFLREKISRLLILGIFLSVLGALLIGWGDFQAGGRALWGDFLALLGAMTASAYFLIGRRLRARLDLLTYIFVVYGVAAVVLLILTMSTREPLWGYTPLTYLWMILMALGPQLVGHTAYNWSLRYVSAATVAVVTLGEPIVSTLLAYFFLGEELTLLTFGGGALTLLGIYLALRGEQNKADI
jgi:drug/metabolite transporter (DMT)-like permease